MEQQTTQQVLAMDAYQISKYIDGVQHEDRNMLRERIRYQQAHPDTPGSRSRPRQSVIIDSFTHTIKETKFLRN